MQNPENMNIPFEYGAYRDFYHRYIFIECKPAMEELAQAVEVMDGADGILVYGIIDGNQGMTYALLNSAKIKEDGTLELGPSIYNEEDIPRLRYEDVQYYTFSPAEEYGVKTSIFDEVTDTIRDTLETKDHLLRAIYNLEVIDGSRDPVAPNYVTVICGRELIWTRITGFGPDYIYGETLTGTQLAGCNVMKDQTIGFRIMDFGDRISLVYDPEIVIE